MQARELWHETGLVFTTSIGTEMNSHNIRRSMRRLTKAAWLGESWTPRESGASLMCPSKVVKNVFGNEILHA